jgi:Flp pilus assembly pilin Flp
VRDLALWLVVQRLDRDKALGARSIAVRVLDERGSGEPLELEEDLHMSDILLRPIIAMQVAVHQLREREDGQTTTEYAILLGFLAIAIIIALFFLRNVLRSLFSNAASSVSRGPGG